MRLRTTSTHRTYRYVRLSLIGVLVFLGVGIGAQVALGGPLGSVSAAYYTPARNVFVGALCAVSLALLALSGRSVEQALLDLAAVLAPVIALVPTPVTPAAVPGFDPGCPDATPCVPASALADVANGMLTLSVIGALAVVTALIVGAVQRTLTVGGAATILAAGVLVLGGTAWWMLAPESFVAGAHFAATLGFFALVAAVAALAALRPSARSAQRRSILRLVYAVIAAGITVSLLFLAAVTALDASGASAVAAASSGRPLVFAGEAVALVLFAVFWLVQTVELWDDTDPSVFSTNRE